jgi:hypothetical protein
VDKWLNRLGNIAIIVLAVVAVTCVFQRGASSPPTSQPRYQPGDRLDRSKLNIGGRTLIIATKSTCRYCSESMSFYRSLATRKRFG